MKILIMNKFGHSITKHSDFVPRIGDSIDVFYRPLPKVVEVIVWPTPEALSRLKLPTDIDVIVEVD